MKLYALALVAQRRNDGGRLFNKIVAAYCQAGNKEEAIGIGVRICRNTFPLRDGWFSHQADVLEIPPEAGEIWKQ